MNKTKQNKSKEMERLRKERKSLKRIKEKKTKEMERFRKERKSLKKKSWLAVMDFFKSCLIANFKVKRKERKLSGF